MMARWLVVLSAAAAAAGSTGCCCFSCHGGPGGECCLYLPKPIVWDGCCNECGPHGRPCGDNCAGGCGPCGILPWLIWGKTCGKGCGEIYWGEWVSDPPDCCDPCDQCTGCWTGHRYGPCNLGPCQRLLAALHGYSYCPPPNCGPSCGPICGGRTCGCGPVCGCGHCGGAGCSECSGGPHGASIYYGGSPAIGGDGVITDFAPENILDENWNFPKAKPEPGKPMQKAEQPTRGQFSQRSAGSLSYPPYSPYPPRQVAQRTTWR